MPTSRRTVLRRPAPLLAALALLLSLLALAPAPAWAVTAPKVTSTSTTVSTATLGWSSVSGAASYRIKYSTSSAMTVYRYHSATTTKATISALGANMTYYFKVQALKTGGAELTGYSSVVALKTKPKVVPPADPAVALRVGSYNVACEKCTDTPEGEEGTWYERRAAVVSTIKGENLDVLGIQEASQGPLTLDRTRSQFDDLLARLGSPWAITNSFRYNCVNSNTPTSCQAQERGASHGTRIFYNSSRLTLTAQGSKLLPSLAGDNERFMAWAVLRQNSTGKSFFFVSQHLQGGSENNALRKREAEVALSVIRAKNTANLPVLSVGDLNSTRFNTGGNVPYDVYVKGGLVDPLGGAYKTTTTAPGATVERAVNRRVSSWNDFQRKVRVAKSTWVNGSNLDYILTTRMRVTEWKTVAAYDANGNFVGRIPSDHNLVRATVQLP